MPNTDISNKELLRKLRNQADELGCIVANRALPVCLKAIADRRRVTSVEFVPMPVRAMLTTHSKGFRVFLKIEDADQATALKLCYENEDQRQLLPLKFRFPLAHELAHTLFYELGTADDRPKEIREFKAGGGKTILENLEKYCNRIAGHLLMPSPLFKNKILKLKSLQPHDLLSFAEHVGASLESVVTRLDEEDGALIHHDLRGCIAAIRKSGKRLSVKAIARPRKLNVAREIRLIQAGEEWQIKTDSGGSILNGEAEGTVKLHLTLETNLSSQKVEHALNFVRYNSFEHGESYVFHLVAIGPLS